MARSLARPVSSCALQAPHTKGMEKGVASTAVDVRVTRIVTLCSVAKCYAKCVRATTMQFAVVAAVAEVAVAAAVAVAVNSFFLSFYRACCRSLSTTEASAKEIRRHFDSRKADALRKEIAGG